MWAKNLGFKWFHLGGGAPNLMLFKSGFSKLKCKYYIGTNIFNKNIYDELVKIGINEGYIISPAPTTFFPTYRAFLSKNQQDIPQKEDSININGISGLVGRNKVDRSIN